MKPSIPKLVPAALAALLAFAAPAWSQRFQPCSDAATLPALAGSLCMTATMPLRQTVAEGSTAETVDLFVRKIPATDPARRRGEVWLVAGGPGETGASFLPVLPVLRRAFPNHDLIFPDHRGTGYSSKLCPEQEAPASANGISLAGEEWGPCIGAMHANAARTRAFTITNAAHDLSALIRRHRGRGETYLYGVSYGTQLVLRMMQVTPVPLTGIILDGLVPPESAPQWDLSQRTRVVDAVGRAVLAPDQAERYRLILARNDPPWKAAVPGGNLRQFMGALLNFPELRDQIPAIIGALARDDAAPLTRAAGELRAEMAKLGASPQSPPSLPLVILISGSENNARRDLTRELVEREAEGALFTSPIPGMLVDSPLPLYEPDAFFGHTPARLPRTLVIHGTLDPNTPFEGAQAHVAMLARAGDVRLATVTGGAHFLPLVAPRCFVQAAAAFVARRTAPDRCEEANAQPARD
ncbi:alpha/beta hydrolase [Longimicrobium terrae]|nr:alpha/beta hydrolase [Longimicrobium terrae]